MKPLTKKILVDVGTLIAIVLICVVIFGINAADAIKEVAIFAGIGAMIALALGGLVAWGCTRAMNPRRGIEPRSKTEVSDGEEVTKIP